MTKHEPLLDERFWNSFLRLVETGHMVPIIGQELVVVQDQKTNKVKPIQRFVAEELIKVFTLSTENLADHYTLNHIVGNLLRSGVKRNNIYLQINEIMEKSQPAIPEWLKKLARIRHFKLFVSMTFDPFLQKALDQERFAGTTKTLDISYAPDNPNDLPKEMETSYTDRTTVFYLMGKLSPIPEYAISEEDILEHIVALLSDQKRPTVLFRHLFANHLLILGSNYPDWLTRFFIRIAKGKKLSHESDFNHYLADDCIVHDQNLRFFLSHFSKNTEVLPNCGPFEFVDQLYQRWSERNPQPAVIDHPSQIKTEMEDGALFISYASQDLKEAVYLKEALESIGINVWLDKSKLESGEIWESAIRKNIHRCSYFIPLISLHTETRKEGYFIREWNMAIERAEGMKENFPFIHPVVIDDTSPYSDNVPKGFKRYNWTCLPSGKPTYEFIQRLRFLTGKG